MIRALPLLRLLTFLFLSIFSSVVVFANVNYITITTNPDSFLSVGSVDIWPADGPAPFSAFSLAVAIITLVTIWPMRIADIFAPNAFICTVLFEVIWLGLLDCFWLGVAAWSTVWYSPWATLCPLFSQLDYVGDACLDMRLDVAFGYINFILLLGYHMMILVFGILSSQNGKSAWMESVRTTKFGYDKSPAATVYRGTTSYGGDEFKSQDIDVKPGYLPEEVNVSLPSYGGSRTGFGAVGGVGSV